MPHEDKSPHASTLEAYRAAKWETLQNEGPIPLRRELAKLIHYLDSDPSPYMAHTDVDDFRKAKARILEELLRAEQEAKTDTTP